MYAKSYFTRVTGSGKHRGVRNDGCNNFVFAPTLVITTAAVL